MRFVESKVIDWARVQAALLASERQNQWTNFGPVSRELERSIAQILDVPPDRAVVAASSATSALFALVGVSAARAGRPLRWLASAFGFASTRIGPLASVRLVDCDNDGLLDLDSAAHVPLDDWDGLLVTNVFGRCADFATFVEFCRERAKVLVIDNAQGLLGSDRSLPDAPEEFISFHHTKPWGFGEGGCAIVRREDEALLRRLLNFGYGAPQSLSAFAANGKMSDIAAATILARLESWPALAPEYFRQGQRVTAIATDVGFRVFAQPTSDAVIGFVPLLAPRPTGIAPIQASALPLAKYYPPLADLPCARRLFEHIVCVVSHPGIGTIDEFLIRDELRKLIPQDSPKLPETYA